MSTQNKHIALLSDEEITSMLQVCAGFFGTVIRKELMQSFIFMLRRSFNMTKDADIVGACSSYASANTSEGRIHFSPAFLSAIIKRTKTEEHPNYKYRETTDDQKKKYKALWLEAVYKDFDDYCNKIEPSRVFMWGYLADELKARGVISDGETTIATTRNKKRHSGQIGLIADNGFRILCLKKFHDIAMKSEHISKYIQ